ncbi:MAG: hypothetical protein U0229_14010 [Anaeromyxobacter sp.]
MTRVRLALGVALALAASAGTAALARPQQPSGIDAENERRARAGLLPRKAAPTKPAPTPAPPPGAAPVPAHPPPPAAVAAPRPEPTAGGALPPPRPAVTSSPVEAAVVAARALAGNDSAPAPLAIDAVPLAVRGLSVAATVRVRAGRVTLSVDPAPRQP